MTKISPQPTADFNKDTLEYASLPSNQKERLKAWILFTFPKKGRFKEVRLDALARHFGTTWAPRKYKRAHKRRKPLKPIIENFGGGQTLNRVAFWFRGKGKKYLEAALKESEEWANGFRK